MNLVQPILVNMDAPSHEVAVESAAKASLQAYFVNPEARWGEWLAGPFTKTVRRFKPKDFSKFLGLDIEYSLVGYSLGLMPMKYEDFPKLVARAQVSGLIIPKEHGIDTVIDETTPRILINDSLEMSTGKECAQAAHGFWAHWLHVDSPMHYNYPKIYRVDETAFNDYKSTASVVITDNGLTEFEGKTDTVLIFA